MRISPRIEYIKCLINWLKSFMPLIYLFTLLQLSASTRGYSTSRDSSGRMGASSSASVSMPCRENTNAQKGFNFLLLFFVKRAPMK